MYHYLSVPKLAFRRVSGSFYFFLWFWEIQLWKTVIFYSSSINFPRLITKQENCWFYLTKKFNQKSLYNFPCTKILFTKKKSVVIHNLSISIISTFLNDYLRSEKAFPTLQKITFQNFYILAQFSSFRLNSWHQFLFYKIRIINKFCWKL